MTFGELTARIADDLMRSDLTSQIQESIRDAIRYYERQRFYFNEARRSDQFSTQAGKEFYGPQDFWLIGSMAQLDQVTVLAFGNRYTLTARTEQYLEGVSVNPQWAAMPTDYAYYGKTLRLYPIPDQSYPVTFSGTVRFQTLEDDADSNPWTCDAMGLIRARAKWELAEHVLNDDALAQRMEKAIALESQALRGETTRRTAGARVRPTQF